MVANVVPYRARLVRQQAGRTVTLREHVPQQHLSRFRVYVERRYIGGAETAQDVESLVTEYIDNIAKPVF